MWFQILQTFHLDLQTTILESVVTAAYIIQAVPCSIFKYTRPHQYVLFRYKLFTGILEVF
ncbi:Uncharacterised protein [Neisseria sicca]|nr:Uncharacterised protein [Neisseria sicca]